MAISAQQLDKTRPRRVYYPDSDGKPMAETDTHRKLMNYCIEALTAYYADRPDVYISGNNFIYYEEGNPKARISPDCYVVFGVPMRERNSYKAWEEGGRLPDVIFEFTSKKTRREDVHKKRPLYEQVLRVPEYFQFDPTGDYLKPRLQGFRLVGGEYVPILMLGDRLRSEQLGLELVQSDEDLRLYDPVRQTWLLKPLEQAQRAEAEAQRAATSAQRAEAAAQRAEEQAQFAQAQVRRAEAAEAEIERLRAQIEALKGRNV